MQPKLSWNLQSLSKIVGTWCRNYCNKLRFLRKQHSIGNRDNASDTNEQNGSLW